LLHAFSSVNSADDRKGLTDDNLLGTLSDRRGSSFHSWHLLLVMVAAGIKCWHYVMASSAGIM
jgi:hypothetical protein